MNAKTVTSAVLIGMWCACAVARGQESAAPSVQPPPIQQALGKQPELLPPPAGAPPAGTPYGGIPYGGTPYGATPYSGGPPAGTVPIPGAPTLIAPSLSGVSDWIAYRRPECCSAGPLSPLYSEVFLRVGPSIAVGGNFLGRELQPGWTIDGGIRGLLFDPASTRAWVVEFSILNSNNSGIQNGDPLTLSILRPNAVGTVTRQSVDVTVKNYNRTMVGVGGGREWYIWQPADAPGGKWRIGVDAGGRYGSASMTFNEIRHRTDVIAGMYAAIHTDYEIPCGHCYLSFGARAEWAYTWGDILQRQSDVQEINALVTFGVRY